MIFPIPNPLTEQIDPPEDDSAMEPVGERESEYNNIAEETADHYHALKAAGFPEFMCNDLTARFHQHLIELDAASNAADLAKDMFAHRKNAATPFSD